MTGPWPGIVWAGCRRARASRAWSQPLRLPSSTGMWRTTTRSPANRVPVASSRTVEVSAVGVGGGADAWSTSTRPPRSSRSVSSTSRDGGMIVDVGHQRPSPKLPAEGVDIELAARCAAPPRQVAVAHEGDAGGREGGVAEDMIGMHVSIDDEADRLCGPGPHRRQHLLAFAHAAAAVDHRHDVATDDETRIGDGAFVGLRHQGHVARMHEDAGRDLAHRQGRGRRPGARHRPPRRHDRGRPKGKLGGQPARWTDDRHHPLSPHRRVGGRVAPQWIRGACECCAYRRQIGSNVSVAVPKTQARTFMRFPASRASAEREC